MKEVKIEIKNASLKALTPLSMTTTIDMPYEDGIYFLKLTMQNGEVLTKKVVKER